MSKAILPALQGHLDSGSTSMVYCWRIERRDGLVQGFTEHDEDLTFSGTTYLAASGFTATKITTELGLSVDNLNAEGALSSDAIDDAALSAGLYDASTVELYWVNFLDLAQRVLLLKGTVGEVRRGEVAFSAELRSLTHLLQQRTGRTYRRYCDADLGDTRCKVDLSDLAFRTTGTVSGSSGDRLLTVTGLSPNESGFYSLGKVEFTSGQNQGAIIPVKVHSVSAGVTRLTLWEPTPFPLTAGTTFELVAGCDKRPQTCAGKFSNIANYQGFPFIPGNDVMLKVGKPGGSDQEGGSRGIFS